MSRTIGIAALGLVIAIGGCASNRPDTGAVAEEVKGYCAQRLSDDRINPVREKILIPLTIGEPQPIEMLANRTYPTDDERTAIQALSEAQNDCQKFAKQRMGPPPSYRSSSQDRVAASLSELYAGEITYGEFARSMLFIGARDQAAREDLEQAVQARQRWMEIDAAN